MEPQLQDMDDYEKPLSKKKFRTIILAFIGIMAISAVLSYLLNLVD